MHPEIARIQSMLDEQGYVADEALATSVYLAIQLRKPLLIEGAAGVGKTEVAKLMARALNTDLIRLQCYEGLDATTSLYEWNYQRQLLHIRLLEQSDKPLEVKEREIFSEPFLLKRPLLAAITHHRAPVLLLDEVDRADDEWESFLLEVLSDWQVSIPEIGTIKAQHIPHVVLTSNRSRELGDALRRRCLYLWIDYPLFDKELAIVRRKVPGVNGQLAEQIAAFMQFVRRTKLEKTPGLAETLDWSAALIALHRDHLDRDAVEQTLGVLFKQRDDADLMRTQWLDHLLRGVHEVGQEPTPWNQQTIDRVATRLSRRARQTLHGHQMDLRRTIRHSLRRGGEIVDLFYRRRKIRKTRVVLLADVSGSMDLYSRFLIQFIFALQHTLGQVETMVFSTTLTRVTDALSEADLRQALEQVAKEVPDWSGGTKIGHSLLTFLMRHGGTLLTPRTVVLIISDGWDTGDIDVLTDAMKEIRSRAGRVIWLNPLLGSPGYETS